ncbi:MAG TPA: lytic transglycosylase domain-containing protein [Clostridiales bacterium]|jgi:soluble lytic murein transglycosylase|nr:lytic transglycosylase domain-containing protein [Clostridiales bacterium]
MKKNSGKRPPLALRLTIILLAALLFGYLYSLMYTAYLKSVYPRDFGEYVSASSKEFGVPEQVLFAVIKSESNFDANAVSKAGAIGLMQLLPSTFRWLSDDVLGERLDSALIYDPETNIKYGACMLARLFDYYGNWDTAFAAYNAGMGTVNGWLGDSRYSDGDGRLTNIPYDETRRYVVLTGKAVMMYEKLYYSDLSGAGG